MCEAIAPEWTTGASNGRLRSSFKVMVDLSPTFHNTNRAPACMARQPLWGFRLALVLGLTGLLLCAQARAQDALTSPRVPPDPTPDQVEKNVPDLANPLNKPVTGASQNPLVVGTEPPPSLEALQAARPGDEKGNGMEPGRAEMVRTAALTYGAQGGLAARSFALNEMLRRYQPQLDSAFDFRPLVLPVGAGQTLMRPPIVSAAQLAFALGDGGQVAREAEMHVRMSEVCGGAAVIEHDFCQPPAAPQDDRDRRFRRACGATLLRPRSEHNPSGAHIAVRAAQDHCTDRSAAGS